MESETTFSIVQNVQPAWYRLATWLAGFIVLGYVITPPWSLTAKLNLIGYGICHQIAEHSYIIGGHQLPLCARCSGTYFGILLGLVAVQILGRRRAAELPPVRVIIVLLGFIGIMAIDGVNSYINFFPAVGAQRAAPLLYTPRNILRLSTGMLNGVTMIILVYPIFNFTLWKKSEKSRVLTSLGEVGAIVLAGIPVVLLVESQMGWLYLPLAILSAMSVLFMLTVINTIIATVIMRRENIAETWRDVLQQMLFGLVLGLFALTFMGVIRVVLTRTLGLDF